MTLMHRTAQLAHAGDWPAFAAAVRSCMAQGVAWDAVDWRVAQPATPAGASTLPVETCAVGSALNIRLPASFVDTAQAVMLHREPTRYLRLHRMVERIHANRNVWADSLDAECLHLQQLQRQVRRDMHKMKAFVRFTRVQDDDGERFVAWFEPEHHIVAATAPFFARRFTGMRWAILTQQTSVQWDGHALHWGPPACKQDAPAPDAGESLWLTYFQSIFNPARVKVAMMKKEMPVRYWPNLPEARLIAPMLAAATERAGQMVAHHEVRDRRLGQATQAAMNATSGAQDEEPSDLKARTKPAALAPPNAAPRSTPQQQLDSLQRQAANCQTCPFACDATQTVWGEGRVGAALMLVGEQPGDREDLEGRPFVGPAGKLLRSTLQGLGWPQDQLYLTNAVKHFKYTWSSVPRGPRRMHKTASQREALACSPWLEAEITAVAPRAIVALGATAARSLLGGAQAFNGSDDTISVQQHAGQWFTRRDGLPVLVVHHPAALLRQGAAQAGSDMLLRWSQQLALAGAYLRLKPGLADPVAGSLVAVASL